MFKQAEGTRFRRAAPWIIVLLLAALETTAQIQLGKPKGEQKIGNPSIIGASRDDIVTATKQMLETREIPLEKEDCSQTTGECTLISKPVVFTRGLTTRSQLQHFCEVTVADVRNWVKGRYVLRVQIAPASPITSEVGVYAKFEGMTDGLSGSEWVPLSSKGELEDKLLKCIRDRVRGLDCKDER